MIQNGADGNSMIGKAGMRRIITRASPAAFLTMRDTRPYPRIRRGSFLRERRDSEIKLAQRVLSRLTLTKSSFLFFFTYFLPRTPRSDLSRSGMNRPFFFSWHTCRTTHTFVCDVPFPGHGYTLQASGWKHRLLLIRNN